MNSLPFISHRLFVAAIHEPNGVGVSNRREKAAMRAPGMSISKDPTGSSAAPLARRLARARRPVPENRP